LGPCPGSDRRKYRPHFLRFPITNVRFANGFRFGECRFHERTPTFLARIIKESKWYDFIGAAVLANFFLFAVLAMFFEGGAFLWGEIIGSNYYVTSNVGDFEVSAWFWISYWQGLSAWAGAGIYGVGAFLHKLIADATSEDDAQVNRSAFGLLFVLAWLGFVLWGAVRIVS